MTATTTAARRIGDLEVGPIGFGCNEELVGRVLSAHRDQIVLASKGGTTGVDGKRVIDGRPETIRATAEAALRRLRTDVIDVYYLRRLDPALPVAESVGAIAELVEAGSVRHIGRSEVSEVTVRRAHAVHPIAGLENEYSLWTRSPDLGTDAACRELGIALVAFSPLAGGLLTSATPDISALSAQDIRRGMPRFQGEAYAANLGLHRQRAELAAEADCTPAQLALACLLNEESTSFPSRGPGASPPPGNRGAQPFPSRPRCSSGPASWSTNARSFGPTLQETAAAGIATEAFPQAG